MPAAPTQKTATPRERENTTRPSSAPAGCRTLSADLVRVEKNLASLGFFTLSNKKIKGARAKTILFSRQAQGQRIEVRAVIVPSAAYGLPLTSDQDKYLALQKIISDVRRQQGEVRPIGVTSSAMLRILELSTDAGKNV